jgi:hypothetical protein
MTDKTDQKRAKPWHPTKAELVVLNEHGWMSYEAERRMNEILRRRIAALESRLAKYEWSLEHQS